MRVIALYEIRSVSFKRTIRMLEWQTSVSLGLAMWGCRAVHA